jgi:carotenoid cleavage dioxygenase-like enzyme
MTTHELIDAASDDTPAHHRGNGRPIDSERTITDLVVTGSIPAELDGR